MSEQKQTPATRQNRDISANTTDGSEGRHRMSYRDVAMHKVMLQDIVRTEAYQKSIESVVKSHHSVLDFGCGTGVLSMFAARAGAKRVMAVDRSEFIQSAQHIARANGFNNIDFYHDDHESLSLDEPVDVLVSEWMGHCLFYEAMLEPLLSLRDRYLKDDGIMIPSTLSLRMGLVNDEAILEDLRFLHERPYGLDFSAIADAPLEQSDLVALEPECMLESVALLGTLNMKTLEKASTPRVFTAKLTPSETTDIYALCGWFSAQLSQGVEFGTGPFDTPTHWDQILFPLPKPFHVSPDKDITISLSPLTEQLGKEQFWSWSISDGENTLSVNELSLQRQRLKSVPQGKL
ncbi:50S ribosomal protein L11 methyltransferase [Glaciecola siphonariae]|uniref:50S ribosomal protein L11 methyltransferase n=1 Tax=Glaciecola siphonariae TaxID=521012 RepID=A0ABV9LW14_9ALTE